MIWKSLQITPSPTARIEMVTFGKPAGIFKSRSQFVPKIICELFGNVTVVSEDLPNLTLNRGMIEYIMAHLPTALQSCS